MSSYLKTKQNNADVWAFLDSIKNDQQKKDSLYLLDMMRVISGVEPKMWGKQMVGFGNYSYKTKAGKVGEWFLIGFSPRKNNISLHLMFGLEEQADLLNKLGKHSKGKGCLYINKLDDIDEKVLKEIMTNTFIGMQKQLN